MECGWIEEESQTSEAGGIARPATRPTLYLRSDVRTRSIRRSSQSTSARLQTSSNGCRGAASGRRGASLHEHRGTHAQRGHNGEKLHGGTSVLHVHRMSTPKQIDPLWQCVCRSRTPQLQCGWVDSASTPMHAFVKTGRQIVASGWKEDKIKVGKKIRSVGLHFRNCGKVQRGAEESRPRSGSEPLRRIYIQVFLDGISSISASDREGTGVLSRDVCVSDHTFSVPNFTPISGPIRLLLVRSHIHTVVPSHIRLVPAHIFVGTFVCRIWQLYSKTQVS